MKHKKVYRKGTNCSNETLQEEDLDDIEENDEVEEDDYVNSHNNNINFDINLKMDST